MMITFYSIMMALIWVSVIITIIFLLRRNIHTIAYFNIKTIFLMYAFCILRICLPLEFSFTKVVETPFLYNWMFPQFMQDFRHFPITPWELIIFTCSIVSIFMLFRLLYQYVSLLKTIHDISHYQNNDILQTIKAKYPEFKSLKNVIIHSSFQTPMQVGILSPTILLPHTNYDEIDLYYILKHEMTHYYNRDTWIKLGLNLWRCIFWWFPLTYLLFYELDESLELKCDYSITKDMTELQKKNYLTALLHVYEQQSESTYTVNIFADKVTALYKDEKTLLNRFQHITTKKKEYNTTLPVLIIFFGILAVSYLFIFQGYGEPVYPNDKYTYFSLDNSYLYLNEKGEYDLYVDNEFVSFIHKNDALKLIKAGITYKNFKERHDY